LTELVIDLGGSLDRRFRLADVGTAYLDGLLPRLRRGIEGKVAGEDLADSLKRFVRSNG
jgi:hypothetical protein